MKYLIDTNIWIERLLKQEKEVEGRKFLSNYPSSELAITDFSFHSIAIILLRFAQEQALIDFTRDLFEDGNVGYVRLEPTDTNTLITSKNQFRLDFDDAYQLECARKLNLQLISFDKDFANVDLNVLSPADVIS